VGLYHVDQAHTNSTATLCAAATNVRAVPEPQLPQTTAHRLHATAAAATVAVTAGS